MGYRFLTASEFDYIKDLLKRNRRDVNEVAKLHPRSTETIERIRDSKNFAEYKGGNVKTPTKKVEVKKTTNRQYDGAILAEMKRLRTSIDNLNSHFGNSRVDVLEEKTESEIEAGPSNGVVFALIVILGLLIVGHFSGVNAQVIRFIFGW